MSDVAAVASPVAASPAAAAPKKAKAAAKPKVAKSPKTAKPAADHPAYSAMIATAIKELKDRKGASKQAISKYLSQTFKIGELTPKINAHIRKALLSGVASGALVQAAGTGASGRFRIAEKPKAVAAPKAKKSATAKSPKKAAPAKKTASKKTAKPSAEKKAKSPKKAPAKPKVKKTSPKKAAAKPKKVAAKKTQKATKA